MRSEEWAKPTRVVHKQGVKVSTERSEHLNAGASPALEGLQGQGTESLAEFEAEPQSRQPTRCRL